MVVLTLSALRPIGLGVTDPKIVTWVKDKAYEIKYFLFLINETRAIKFVWMY